MKAQQTNTSLSAPGPCRHSPTGAMQQMANQSPHTQKLAALQRAPDLSPAVKRLEKSGASAQRMEPEKDELMQGKTIKKCAGQDDACKQYGSAGRSQIRNPRPLGHADGQSVGSPKIQQARASAGRRFAQDSDIHLDPGQEQYLPHEAWHLLQQAQAQVKPTTQREGVSINDN